MLGVGAGRSNRCSRLDVSGSCGVASGIEVSGDHFVVGLCPENVAEFTMKYRYKTTTYEIKVLNPDRVETVFWRFASMVLDRARNSPCG